ncbi:MAG: DUF502 domain-containing protein [Phycisphaerales bacterium]|nr:DUF502 domain-containing protein [Phycisphaerales bacterium]
MLTGSWRDKVSWYFPGLGLLLALVVVGLVGLFVTTFVGRWMWRGIDRLLECTPLLGALYQSLKKVLGYDNTRERFFRGFVAVPADDGYEFGFFNGEGADPNGAPHTLAGMRIPARSTGERGIRERVDGAAKGRDRLVGAARVVRTAACTSYSRRE